MLQLNSTANSPADVAEAALLVPPTLSLAASNGAAIAGYTPATTEQKDKASPASSADVQAAASRLGFAVPEAHKEDYLHLLQATDRAAAALLEEPGELNFISYLYSTV